MGHEARFREQAAAAVAALSPVPRQREDVTPAAPSEWLEEQCRQFGGSLIHASNELARALNPPRVLGADGAAPVPRIDPMRAILTNQLLLMRALSAMNDLLLVTTVGKGVLEPVKPQES